MPPTRPVEFFSYFDNNRTCLMQVERNQVFSFSSYTDWQTKGGGSIKRFYSNYIIFPLFYCISLKTIRKRLK